MLGVTVTQRFLVAAATTGVPMFDLELRSAEVLR